ncbi:MAG TPA: acyltransferase [Pseudomonadales bacterium]|nr:acyltransferase [Pseudomonadales bacterium]
MQINIQLLRFLATLAVVLCHAAPHYIAAGGTGYERLFHYLPVAGNVGVDAFFVISGYILWITTSRRAGPGDSGKFLYRRATRIYLGYWPFLLLMVAMHAWYKVPEPADSDLWGSILLTQNESRQLLLPVAWTLSYEVYFYLVFSILLLLPVDRRLQGVLVWLALFLLAMTLLWLVFNGHLKHGSKLIIKACSFALSSYCLDFIGGCLLARHLEKGGSINKIGCGILFITLMGIVAYCYARNDMGANAVMNYPYRRAALYGIAAIVLVALMAGLEKDGRIFAPQLSLLLGNATYSTYLSHTILLEWLYHTGLRNAVKDGQYPATLFIVFALVFVMAYSLIHFRWIETPLMSLSRKLARRWENKEGKCTE